MGYRLVGCGLSSTKWVVADEMGKGGAHGLSPTVLVGARLSGKDRGEDGRKFGPEVKGRRWR